MPFVVFNNGGTPPSGIATPANGTFALDAANSRIGVYISGTWRYATLT